MAPEQAAGDPATDHRADLYALLEARGDAERAATHYVKFLALWERADPELQPMVTEVKQRLARLRAAELH